MGQILVKHRRGTTAKWIEWCKDESNILLDGEIGIEDLSDGDGNSNGMRLLIGDGMHHSYEELRNIIIPDSLPSQGYDYAEYFMWSDDVPEDDRVIGRFVTIAENTRTIRLAQPDSKVLGITTGTASVIGNYTEEKQNDSRWVQVGMLGVVQARHDGTCTENGYAMIGDNGVATLAPGPFGYKIVNVNSDNNTIEVVLGNDSDMISRIQSSMIDKPGVITDDGGIIFNDYENNEALGPYNIAMGSNCTAGTKGYYYQSIDTVNKKIYLTEQLVERTVDIVNEKTEQEIIESDGGYYIETINSEITDKVVYRLDSYEFSNYNPGAKYNVYKQDGTYVGYFVWGKLDDSEPGLLKVHAETTIPDLVGYDGWADGVHFSQCGTDEPYVFRYVKETITTANPIISTEDFTDTSFETPAYEIGDKFNIINFSHYVLCGEITAIQNNVISYKDDLPFNKIEKDIDDDAYAFWVPTKPEVGIVLPFDYATVGGNDSKATGRWSTAFGYHNIAADNFATAFGNDNIAGYSAFAVGKDSKALGYHSAAIGYENMALGKSSFVTGYHGNAIGAQAFVAGSYCEARGENSFAAGLKTITDGINSVAFGNIVTSTGDNSFAFGERCNATGKYSFAGGFRSTASNEGSIALGHSYSEASGLYSIAIGREAKAYGESSISIGRGTEANKFCGVALGQGARSSHDYAVAIGYGATAGGLGSVALGGYSSTVGKYAIAGGDHCSSHGQGSTAFGHYTSATGTGSFATGVFTKTTIAGQTAMGKYNAEHSSAFLIVGNGNAENNRKNAFEVLANGTANLQTQGTNDNSVIIGSTLKRIAGITTIPTTGTYANNNEALAVKITALQSEVETLKSDLETALDNIIAIQESLIGCNE